VYTRPGASAAYTTSPSAWQPLGAVTVSSDAATDDTAIPLALNVAIGTLQTQAFAIDVVSGPALLATIDAPSNPAGAQDDAITVIPGTLTTGFFTPSSTIGIFQGVLWRTAAPAAVPFQRNHGRAWLDIDGVESNGLLPASTGLGSGSIATASSVLWIAPLGTDMPYDVAVAIAPLVAWPSPGALATTASQVINIDVAAPSLFFLNSGTGIPALLLPSGVLALPLPASGGTSTVPSLVMAAQMFVLDPTSADGVALSQGVEHGF
jgi:hypothetical protein